MTAPDWMADAVCAQTDPEAFFPEHGQSSRAARAICRTCPAMDECLRYALARPGLVGVWGGTTERERRPRGSARTAAASATQVAMNARVAERIRALAAQGRNRHDIAALVNRHPDTVSRIIHQRGAA